MVVTTAQLHSTKSELRFCAGSNPARGTFYCPELKKQIVSRSNVMGTYHFWAKMTKLPKFRKTFNIIFMSLLALSLCKIVKQSLTADPELWGRAIFGNFWRKSLILYSSTYWLLSLCKIFKKFLQPIRSYEDAPFLGPKWAICPNKNFFHRMLMNHKNFCFTPIPDKTNDVIFLEVPKPSFWTIFGHFARWPFFTKKKGCHKEL